MIVVFGGNGQLGCEFARAAARSNVALTALSRTEADICDAFAIQRAIDRIRPTLVINAAAYTDVDKAEGDQVAAERVNVTGAANVAAACAKADLPLVHISTDYVFDGKKREPYVEIDPTCPLGVYGQTKADGEFAVRNTTECHVILRTSWLYGEFGHNFLKTILRLAQERDKLQVVADQHGCPTSTRELASVIIHIAPRLKRKEAVWGIYHFAGLGVASWHGFAECIVRTQSRFSGRMPKIAAITTAEYPTPARRPPNSVLDCARFRGTFGLSARHWKLEVEETINNLFMNGTTCHLKDTKHIPVAKGSEPQ